MTSFVFKNYVDPPILVALGHGETDSAIILWSRGLSQVHPMTKFRDAPPIGGASPATPG